MSDTMIPAPAPIPGATMFLVLMSAIYHHLSMTVHKSQGFDNRVCIMRDIGHL
jgi:hypothetical protein